MPTVEGYTTPVSGAGSSQQIQGYARAAYTVYESYVAVQIEDFGARQIYSYLYGVRAAGYVDMPWMSAKTGGQGDGVLYSNPGGSWVWVVDGPPSAWVNIPRTGSDQTAYVRAAAWGVTVNGYGAFPGDTGWQHVASITIPRLAAPGAVTNLVTSRVSDTQATLSWTKGSGVVARYDIYRSTNGGSQTYIGQTTATSYTDNTTSANNYYTYQVRQVNASGSSSTTGSTIYMTPAAPTTPVLVYSPPSSISMSWSNPGVTEESVILQKSTDNINWTTLATLAANSTSHNYTEGSTGTKYFRVYNSGHGLNSGTLSLGSVLVISAPIAPSNVTHVRNSNTQNTVTFTNNSSVEAPYTTLVVQRKTNNGSWVQIETISGSATSYVDNNTQANAYYSYRLVATNAVKSETSSETATTYNTPAAPVQVAAVYQGTTAVLLEWNNPAITETDVEIQVSSDDKETWVDVASIAQDSTSYTDNTAPPGGVYYRVRNTRGSLASAWTLSNYVQTLTKPAVPALTPLPSPNQPMSLTELTLSWRHNPLDGSTQTKAELQYSVNGGTTWTTVTITGATQQYVLDLTTAMRQDGVAITYRVKTWGSYTEGSDYSLTYTVTMRSVPVVTVINPPSNGWVLMLLPFTIQWDYSNNYDMASCQVILTEVDTGRQVKVWNTKDNNILSVQEVYPLNGVSYRIDVEATSSVGMRATASRTFVVDYELPELPSASGAFDIVDLKNKLLVSSHETRSIETLSFSGNCVQSTTTGKNILVFPYYDGNSKITGGVTFTVNYDGSVHAVGTATSDATFYINNAAGFAIPAGTYTLSGCPSGGDEDNGYFMRINYSGFVLSDIGAGVTGTRSSDTSSTVPIYIRVRKGATVNHTFYPQLELGSTATAYEPNTGVIPSPDYPAPITSITGDVEIVVSGKNLIDDSALTQGSINGETGVDTVSTTRVRTNYIPFDVDSIYSTGAVLTIPAGYKVAWRFYDSSKNHLTVPSTYRGFVVWDRWDDWIKNQIVGRGGAYLRLVYAKTDDSDVTPSVVQNVGFQLELGSTATAYEPYMGDTVVTPLGSVELCSLPDGTKDTHDAVTGVVTKRVGKVVFDGSADEVWYLSATYTDTAYLCAYCVSGSFNVKTYLPILISDRTTYADYRTSKIDGGIFPSNVDAMNICIAKSHLSTGDIAGLKAWLAANPVTVYYKLAEPYEVSLESVQFPVVPNESDVVMVISDPPVQDLEITYGEGKGTGGAAHTQYMFLTRVLPDGTELRLYDHIDAGKDIALTDQTPLLNTHNKYRLYAYSVIDTINYLEFTVESNSGRFYALNWGDTLQEVVPLVAEMNYSESPSRVSKTYAISGREDPVEFRGEHFDEPISLACDLIDILTDATDSEDFYQRIRTMQKTNTDILLRQPNGSAVFVKVPDMHTGYNGEKECRTVTLSTKAVYSANTYMNKVKR